MVENPLWKRALLPLLACRFTNRSTVWAENEPKHRRIFRNSVRLFFAQLSDLQTIEWPTVTGTVAKWDWIVLEEAQQ